MTMQHVMVRTQDLKKYYQTGNQTVKALDGVNFEVAEREFVSIIGKSGSGRFYSKIRIFRVWAWNPMPDL